MCHDDRVQHYPDESDSDRHNVYTPVSLFATFGDGDEDKNCLPMTLRERKTLDVDMDPEQTS